MPKEIKIYNPLDMHLHLREGEMLWNIARCSAKYFTGAIIMPNLVPPVDSKEAVIRYKGNIERATMDYEFNPMMTLFFTPYSREFLESVKNDITAIKLYPAGITTNSEGGVESIDTVALAPTLNAMSDLDIPLCIHGETNGFVMDREAEFSSVYEELAIAFPKLKIIMEHITTKSSVDLLDKYDNLYATITIHHLMITLDDVVGGMMKPHNFCKPIAKRPEDRDALLKVALDGHPKVMFGSDSAPHPQSSKESCGCAAGVFTAPIALQLLVQLFDENDKLKNLQSFVSDNAQKIYGITVLEKTVTLVKKEFTVPKYYGIDVVPFMAGEKLDWSVKG